MNTGVKGTPLNPNTKHARYTSYRTPYDPGIEIIDATVVYAQIKKLQFTHTPNKLHPARYTLYHRPLVLRLLILELYWTIHQAIKRATVGSVKDPTLDGKYHRWQIKYPVFR